MDGTAGSAVHRQPLDDHAHVRIRIGISEQSTALAFAGGYRRTATDPADDELLSLIAQEKVSGDLEVHFWNTQAELKTVLQNRLRELLDIGSQQTMRGSIARSASLKSPRSRGAGRT